MKSHHRWVVSALFIVALAASSVTHAALVDRGGGLIYDTDLNITWLADANYAQTSGHDADGLMTWGAANSWAAGLNINGITGWRLPTTNPIDGTTADDVYVSYIGAEDRGHNVSAPGTLYAGSTASEMAHMFYNTLGNKSICDPATPVDSCVAQAGYGLTNTGPFSNVQSNVYWSDTGFTTESPTNAVYKWRFDTSDGSQFEHYIGTSFYAWAVHSGDVAAASVPAVPVPAAVWLFGSGLVGLFGLARRSARPA